MPRQLVCISIVSLLVSGCLSYPFRDSAATGSKLAKRSLADGEKESREMDGEEWGHEGECHDIADQHNCMFVMLNIKPCDAYYRKNCAESCGECEYVDWKRYYKKK